jgi:hypothetical protein
MLVEKLDDFPVRFHVVLLLREAVSLSGAATCSTGSLLFVTASMMRIDMGDPLVSLIKTAFYGEREPPV